ncbi:hypothetical protein G4B88_007813 [Cannabis sativa]|uniref:Uncharacterized protein n=1 Tax=Cannabis sativa TaxID=3483 RepID=A0A7J6EQN2_CANSA|nr:hypothetical protein G4B88_007813 [Cannabis sativa]
MYLLLYRIILKFDNAGGENCMKIYNFSLPTFVLHFISDAISKRKSILTIDMTFLN